MFFRLFMVVIRSMGYSISILFFQMLKGQLLTLLANEMDRKHFLMLFFLWWIALPMTAQPHLSEAFVLEGEWTLDSGDGVLQPQGMVGCVEGNSLYCCHRRSFQNKENAMNSMRNIRNRKNPLAAAALLKSSVTPPLGDPLPFPPWPILW